MSGLDVTAQELAILAERLRDAGETGLKRELTDAIKRGTEPVGGDIRRAMPDYMPDAYAEVLDADLRITTSVLTGASDPGVFVVGRPIIRKRRALPRLESGVLGHPVFGMRSRANPRRWAAWEYQTDGVRAGFFSGPAEDAAPRVRQEIEKALGNIKDQIGRGIP